MKAKLRPQIATRVQIPVLLSRLPKSTTGKPALKEQPAGRLREMRRSFFKGLLRDVRSIKLKPAESEWSGYYDERWPDWSDENKFDTKQESIDQILQKLKPTSVLDVAANEGWYSLLAAKRGARVVAIDSDEGCIARLYRHAKKEGADVLPLVLNILNPTPSFGWKLVQFPSALTRLKCDLVFALALLHHLVISNWQSFARVVELLREVSDKWLVIEFVPLNDEKAQILLNHHRREAFDWYNLENLRSELAKNFSEVEEFESNPEGRVLLLCSV